MRKKNYSSKSAYGYSHKSGKSSSYLKEKAEIPFKWIATGVLALILLGGGSYVAINTFQEGNVQNMNEEVRDMDMSVKGEKKVKADWAQSIAQIAQSDSAATQKYEQLLEMGLSYKVTEREYKKFKADILDLYETGNYLTFESDEAALTNIFKAYVLNEYTNIRTDLQFKLFIDNYLDAVGYVYRDYETSDSEFVKGKITVMNGALEKMQNEE